jgi:hypothetical protein
MDSYLSGIPCFFAIMRGLSLESQADPHKKCLNIFILENVRSIWGRTKSYCLKQCPTDSAKDLYILANQERLNKKIKLHIQPSPLIKQSTIEYWETGQILYMSDINMWIPVLDAQDRSIGLWSQPFPYTARNDTKAAYQNRVLDQIRVREQMLKMGSCSPDPDYMPRWDRPSRREMLTPLDPAPTAPPALVAPASVAPAYPASKPLIPPFVAEALKRDAISQNESCPISLCPFQECKEISITSCYHMFERSAIKSWLQTKSECPICKQKIAGTLDC